VGAGDPGSDDFDGKGDTPQTAPFPSFTADQLPSDWQHYSRYKFKLAQRYPGTMPQPSDLGFMRIDFKSDTDRYLSAVRAYVFEGFIHAGEETNGHPDQDFRAELNMARNWHSVPWMHTGAHPREGLHGLTRELDAPPGKLDPSQTDTLQDWGVAFYNDLGGYTIGQVWKNHVAPNAAASRFPEGTVVFKILFTEGDPQQVPWIEGAPIWWANIDADIDAKGAKQVAEVRLVQMDIAVKDGRAATGWVYGTFVFDPNADVSADEVSKYGAYAKMMPVGLSFGNDPDKTPGMTLEETILSSKVPPHARNTLGFGGRMNGPADNPLSACQSCHSTAEWPAVSAMAPRRTMTLSQKMRWFRNLAVGEPFDSGQTSLGTSLQLQISLRNFFAGH